MLMLNRGRAHGQPQLFFVGARTFSIGASEAESPAITGRMEAGASGPFFARPLRPWQPAEEDVPLAAQVFKRKSAMAERLRVRYYVTCSSPVLGRGSFGIVYRGFDKNTNQAVAIKVSSTLQAGPNHKPAWDSELQVWQTLAKKPCQHVVSAMDYYADGMTSTSYLCLPLADMDLRALTKASAGFVQTDVVLKAARHIMLGLEHLHTVAQAWLGCCQLGFARHECNSEWVS